MTHMADNSGAEVGYVMDDAGVGIWERGEVYIVVSWNHQLAFSFSVLMLI